MNVLSLFDGMSCGQIALRNLGIKYDNYFASEIDKFAIKVTQYNFPNTIQVGDVQKLCGFFDFPVIDLLIGGSPCQGFSFAGKGLNFDDPRSKLFFEYVRLLNELRVSNPDIKFLLENVKMKKEYQDIISEHLGVQPIEINSALVSAQNRKRLYWTNIEGVEQPKDEGLLLKDILEEECFVGEKYYLSDEVIERAKRKHEPQVFKSGARCGRVNFPTKTDGKAKTLTAVTVLGSRETDHILTGLDINRKAPTQRSSTGRCLDDKHNYQYIHVLKNRGVFIEGVDKSNCIDANYYKGIDNHAQRSMIAKGHSIRRLTPIECERLQTVPDNYTAIVSDTQRYKMLGNGWTVKVIENFFSKIYENYFLF